MKNSKGIFIEKVANSYTVSYTQFGNLKDIKMSQYIENTEEKAIEKVLKILKEDKFEEL